MDKEEDAKILKTYICEAIEENLHDMSTSTRCSSHKLPQLSTSHASPEDISSGAFSNLEKTGLVTFDFNLVDSFVEAIKEAMDWEPESLPLKKVLRFLYNLKKIGPMFLLFPEIKEFIEDEWKKSDNRPSLQNRLSKLYLML